VPAARLAALGISFQYREESGFGHRSALIGANLPRVLDWFNAHPRVQRPRRLRFVAGAGDPTEAYWLTAFQITPGATLGSVDARLDDQNRLVVEVENVRRLELNLEAMPTGAAPRLEVFVNGRSVTRVDRRGCLVLRASDGVTWQGAGDATAD
jgi:hypothetical protein